MEEVVSSILIGSTRRHPSQQGSGVTPGPFSLRSIAAVRLALGSLVGAAVTVLALGACSDGEEPTQSTTTVAVTLTTAVDTDPTALAEQVLAAAGARDAVRTGGGAEAALLELGERWCTTALRSDVANADATFEFSLAEFFADHGVVAAVGEPQDARLARALLVGEHAEGLADGVNQVLCPEVVRPQG